MVNRKDNTLIGDSWDELGIEIPNHRANASLDIKVKGCPECDRLGKKKDSSLSLNPLMGIGKCHKCGVSYVVRSIEKPEKTTVSKNFTPPSRENLTKLSDEGLKFFTDRMISQEAVKHHRIAERRGSVAFPYTQDGELVNIKYRSITEKKFSQSGGGKHVVWNYDNAVNEMDAGAEHVILTEGELDVMAFTTADIPCAVSVDSGAPNPNDNVDRKLECITNSFELFERAKTIYIAVDNDENGRRLQEELIRRFEFEKIKIVNFGEYKDANDYLKFNGRDAMISLLENAKDLTLEGIYSIEDSEERIWDMYENGLTKGSTTHYPTIDYRWKWREGEVTAVTGYNNEGKSALYNNLALMKAVFDEWSFGIFSPENFPAEEWYEDILHTYIGKTLDKDSYYRASKEELKDAMTFLRGKFYLVYPEELPTMDEIFKRFDFLVRKHGIRAIIIDPYNQIDHLFQRNETIDLYVSRFMSRLKRFAVSRKVAVILVAHQNPPKTRTQDGNYPEPDGYSIKNGGTISDKADNVVAIYRPYRKSNESDPLVQFISLKIKKKKLVGVTGSSDLAYHWKSNRYLDELLKGKSPLDVKLAINNEVVTKQVVAQQEEWPDELF